MTDPSNVTQPLLSVLSSTSSRSKYTAETLVNLIRDGHQTKLTFATSPGGTTGVATSIIQPTKTIGLPGQTSDSNQNGHELVDATTIGNFQINSSQFSKVGISQNLPQGSKCAQQSELTSEDNSLNDALSNKSCNQQSPGNGSVSMYLTANDLRNLQSFRLLAENDGFSGLVDQSPKISVSTEDARNMQSNRWIENNERKFLSASSNAGNNVQSPSPGCQHSDRQSSLNTTSTLLNPLPTMTGSAFTIKNENQMIDQYDNHSVTINSNLTGTSTDDDDDSSSTPSSRMIQHVHEESKLYPALTVGNGSSGKFLIPAQLQFSDSSTLGLNSTSVAASFSSHTQSPNAQNHFPKSSTPNINISTSNTTTTLVCNADGQLVVPAGQINLLKAFGELHGYKIQTASGGHGLVLSASNQQLRTSGNSGNNGNSGNVTFPVVKQQPHRPNFTTLLPMHQVAQDAARKREMRLQKNREAARECRRKKKEYIKCLENRVAVLENQNKALLDDLRQLRELYCQSAAQQSGSGNNPSVTVVSIDHQKQRQQS